MRAKLGIERAPNLIFGACDPPLANRAIEADPSIGAWLSCYVVLRQADGETIVEVMNPMAALRIVKGDAVRAIVEEATTRLTRAIATLARSMQRQPAGISDSRSGRDPSSFSPRPRRVEPRAPLARAERRCRVRRRGRPTTNPAAH